MGGKAPAAPSCGVTTVERSTVSRRGGPTRSSQETITCQYLGAYSAPDGGANIRDLGGVTCHCTGCGNIGISVLVAAKQKAALQEHAKMQWLACFDSALSAAEVGLERVGVDAD